MELIHKLFEAEVKKLGERQYEFTASTMERDRDGEVIDASGWDLKNFKKNPVIMYGHDYKSLPIGRAPRVWTSNGTLKNTVEFPPVGTYEFADIVERLVDTGFLRTESVGFIPGKWEDGDGDKEPRRTYLKQELIEISIVPVPSNPDALLEAVEKGIITEEELEVVTKPEETEDYIRIPVKREEGKHDGHRVRTIEISAKEGIKAIYCGECKVVLTYLFSKEDKYGWTMARAQAWVREHEKTMSQAEIKDELDYLLLICKENTFNADNQQLARQLIDELKRLPGGDMPVEDKNDSIGVESSKELREYLTKEIKRQLLLEVK